MSKLRTGEPWMPAPAYGRSLRGLTLNLLVEDVARSLPFHLRVLGAEAVYHDPDIAVLRHAEAEWMLHAWHTYDAHPLHPLLAADAPACAGPELRLHGRDPDRAERVAREMGYEVVQASADKPHGLRECFVRDGDGYLWVPDTPTAQAS
jgi:catechol 2,3-dioxygenase-like lactoylglutathione lyase family enzyme